MTSLFTVDVDFRMDSPLFDGTSPQVVDQWAGETLDVIATHGLSQVQFWMDVYFENPTPYYETQVMWERMGDDRVIHDRGIIYGPWLAGTGSRNQTTRFKGYPHWRRTAQWLEEHEIDRVVDLRIGELTSRLVGQR